MHRRGVVHYDVKPRNIVMDEAGLPRLIDFGLARLADAWRPEAELTGSMSGTEVLYTAPEQARGEAAGAAADLFSLGGVLYFLLTGLEPFTGSSFTVVHEHAKRGEWDRTALNDPRVPSGLRTIVLKAMATEPAALRYRSAEELAAAPATVRLSRGSHWLWLPPARCGEVAALGGPGRCAQRPWQPRWRTDAVAGQAGSGRRGCETAADLPSGPRLASEELPGFAFVRPAGKP